MSRTLTPLAITLAGLILPVGPSHAQEPSDAQVQRERRMTREDLIAMFREDPEVDVQAIVGDLPTAVEIDRRRLEIAERMMGMVAVEFLEPPSPTAERAPMGTAINDYLKWSQRRMEARLALAEADDERRAVVAQEVAKLRDVEDFLRRMSAGLGDDSPRRLTPQVLAELEYQRLGVEAHLRRMADGEAPED